MCIRDSGIWYEMFVSDPVAYLFKNTDPRGSLAANVSNSAVRCLSNLPLAGMLVNRHTMSLIRGQLPAAVMLYRQIVKVLTR